MNAYDTFLQNLLRSSALYEGVNVGSVDTTEQPMDSHNANLRRYENIIEDLESNLFAIGADFVECEDDVIIAGFTDDDELATAEEYVDNDASVEEHEIIEINGSPALVVYLNPAVVMFAIDNSYVNDEQISNSYSDAMTEAVMKIKVNSMDERRIKFKCNPGFKYNTTSHACEKISGTESVNRRMGLRHAILTKKAGGASLKLRTIRKAKKAMRYRKSMGLSK